MNADLDMDRDASSLMTPYEYRAWTRLDAHWQRRDDRKGLPSWASSAINRSGDVASTAMRRASSAVPESIKAPARRAGDAAANVAARPALEGAAALIDLVNDWMLDLNDPKSVERRAAKQGVAIDTFANLRDQDLKTCDRLLTRNTLTWRTAGAFEGGAMGLLAMVPVAGIPVAITADVLVIQVLSVSIASRISYSYGFDAKDPAEQEFIQRLVRRSFLAQAAKVKPLSDTARAASAVKGRVRWSPKLRQDHHLLQAIEKLMKQLGPAGMKAPVKNVAKVVPFVGILIGAGMNSVILASVAEDAQRYCQTRFLCEKYGLTMPPALAAYGEEGPLTEPQVSVHLGEST